MEEALIKRILPHSIEAEQSVISSMLMSENAIMSASDILKGEDFYQRRYGIIFEAIVELYNEGKAVDIVTLQNRLKEKNVAPEISEMDFVKELLGAETTSVNIRDYASIVAEKALLRRLIKAAEEVENECYLNQKPVPEIMEESESKMFQIFQQRSFGEIEPISSIVLASLAQIEEASKTKGTVTGIPTGYRDLDNMTSGFHGSELILIAARPSMGKTALALNMAEYMAFKKKKSVAIFSLEMSKTQLMNRLLSMESKVNSQNLRTGNLKSEDWSSLVKTADVIGNSNLMIDDTPGISVGEMRSKCRKYKLEHGLDAVFVDYLQMMTTGKRVESRQTEVAEITRGLKSLARELDVPVVVLSQLNRSVESRTKGEHKPMLSDLRESGSIEQDADVVMFIYRDEYYNHDTEKKGIAEIIIAKQRNGPIGSVELAWLADYTKFMSLERNMG